MPYWSIVCLYCRGAIVDALLECLPAEQKVHPAYRLLFLAQPGAALACPYCGGFIGFDPTGHPATPPAGTPVFRYSQAALEVKKLADGEAATTPLEDWALRHRFTNPGTHPPLRGYLYAEQAPSAELVP